jgi:hypothetical protein
VTWIIHHTNVDCSSEECQSEEQRAGAGRSAGAGQPRLDKNRNLCYMFLHGRIRPAPYPKEKRPLSNRVARGSRHEEILFESSVTH